MKNGLSRRLLLSAPAAVWAGGAFAQPNQPFRFGALMPTTGPEAGYGLDFVKTYEMAVKDINDNGGVDGRPLEMIVLDTQAKPQLAINAANQLIDVDKVPVIITAWSSVVKAVAPIANRTTTLELNMGANSPDIAKLGDYVYTMFPLADVDVTALAKYTRSKLGKTARGRACTSTTTPASAGRRSTATSSPRPAARSWRSRPTTRRRPTSPACC